MGRNPKYTDEELLNRAMVELWRRGPARVSIRDLEDALDMKAPSIYSRFGSMEGLRLAALEHYIERVVTRRVAKQLDGEGDPISNLARFLERSVTEGCDGGGLIGCLLTTAGIEHDGTPSAELQAMLERGQAVIETGIAAEIARADALGLLAPHVDPEAATTMLALVTQGLMVMARSGVTSADLRARARAAASSIAIRDHR